ncbi:hypothetical protein ACFOUV_12800 [Oceanobacillus longus]|uniref:Uncharacterized protein n=1 Tax=Oceanobacillus longus TaxID=930120 RepID=A0ABV8GYD0_9BACI
MMKKLVMVIAVLFASGLLLVACNDNSSENANVNETNAEETGNNEQEVNNEDNINEGNNESDQDNAENESELDDEQNKEENEVQDNSQSDEEQDESDKGNLPAPIEINEQIQHPVGVTFTLEKITFEENHVSVDFNAQNHTGYGTHLASGGRARGSSLGGITLKDDTGYDYRYVADNDSDRIRLDDGEQVTGTISFAGRIQDDAKSLTLIFNPEASDEGSVSMPKFSFEDIEIKR